MMEILRLSILVRQSHPMLQVIPCKEQWVYEPSGIRLKTKYDDSTSRYIIQKLYPLWIYNDYLRNGQKTDCPKCGRRGSMHGIKRYIVINGTKGLPRSRARGIFLSHGIQLQHEKMNTLGSMNFIQPILLEMDAWQPKNQFCKNVYTLFNTKIRKFYFTIKEQGDSDTHSVLIAAG